MLRVYLTLCVTALFASALGATAGAVPTSLPLDPCALLTTGTVAQAVDVASSEIPAPQHPTPNECLWTAAARGGAPAQTVALFVETATTKNPCHGLGCIGLAQSILAMVPGANVAFSSKVSSALANAQMIAGLGDRAGWKDGALTILKGQLALRMVVNAPGSDSTRLDISEALARAALTHL